jgi:hypothetical protein
MALFLVGGDFLAMKFQAFFSAAFVTHKDELYIFESFQNSSLFISKSSLHLNLLKTQTSFLSSGGLTRYGSQKATSCPEIHSGT